MKKECRLYTQEGRPCSLLLKYHVHNAYADYKVCARHAVAVAFRLTNEFGLCQIELILEGRERKKTETETESVEYHPRIARANKPGLITKFRTAWECRDCGRNWRATTFIWTHGEYETGEDVKTAANTALYGTVDNTDYPTHCADCGGPMYLRIDPI